MRKSFSCVLSLMVLLSAVIGLRAQTGSSPNLLYVDFEDGKIPQEWEIVHQRGDCDWVVVSDGVSAGNHFMTLKNRTTVQQNYRTLLVSPVINLTTTVQPVVMFAHRQTQRAGDFDTLRLLYRTAPDKDWYELAVFNSVIDDWRMDTVPINSPTTSYQIAFAGSDNMGGGIDIDNISVRPSPRCEQPSNISFSSPTDTSCTLNWYAGFEAINMRIKVSTLELTPEQLETAEKPEGLVLDTIVPGYDIALHIGGLTPDTRYFAYIQTLCTNEHSDWSEVFPFSTAYRVQLPFYEAFNMPYTASKYIRPEHWTCGTSTGALSPLVNTGTVVRDLHMYSRDATTALCFSTQDTQRTIPAGQWSYAATPMLDVERVQDLHVSFEARFYDLYPSYTKKIVLGVMTNPHDYMTFSPVDTFECTDRRIYYTFSASLDSYRGNGKYIALASDFDEKDNIVFIDNFRVERVDCLPPESVGLKVNSSSELELVWDSKGATTADIVLTKGYTYPSADPVEEGDTIKVIKGIPSGTPYQVTGLTPWSEYYVHVRNVNGDKKSPWSVGKYVRMPDKMVGDSRLFDFKINNADKSTWYNLLPFDDDNVPQRMSLGVLMLHEEQIAPSTVVTGANPKPVTKSLLDLKVTKTNRFSLASFPEIEDIRGYRAKFWYSCDATNHRNCSIIVGIMSDPTDTATFYPLDTIISENKFLQYTINFDTYPEELEGRFFAVLADKTINPHLESVGTQSITAHFYIDELRFEKIPECREPIDIDVTVSGNTAVFDWKKLADSYDIRIHSNPLSEQQLANQDFAFDYKADGVTELPLTVENLDDPKKKYYYYIRPVCGGVAGDWTTDKMFNTECPVKSTLPYLMFFDGYDGHTMSDPTFVPCLYTDRQLVGSSYYPSLNSTMKYNGDASLYFAAQSTGLYNPKKTYVAFPDMETDNVSDLQMTFVVKPVDQSDEPLKVGVMTDPLDTSTFEVYKNIAIPPLGKFTEVVVTFDEYTGSGRHIALMLDQDSTQMRLYIDSVVIEKLSCPKAQYLEVPVLASTSATLSWNDADNASWDLVVATKQLSHIQLDNAQVGTNGVVFSQNIDKKPYKVDGLTSDTEYWFYVRGVCSSEDKASWPKEPGNFRTPCMPLELGDGSLQTFEAVDGFQFSCWTVGNISVPSPSSSTKNYIPAVSDLYRHGGEKSLQFFSHKRYNGAYAISPMVDVDDIRNVEVSFYGATTNRYSNPDKYGCKLILGVVSSPYDLYSFVPLDTIRGYGDGQLYRTRLDRYKTDDPGSGKYVLFMSEYDGENHFYIDNVRFDAVGECAVPVDLESVGTPSSGSAKIKWRGGEAPYTVVYSERQLSEEELDGGIGIVASSDLQKEEYEITGLKSVTTYFVYVKSGCENSLWSAPLRITTECSNAYNLPFRDDFDRNSHTMREPVCWNSGYVGNARVIPYISESFSYKDKSLYVYSSTDGTKITYAVTPELIVDDITRCYVSFYASAQNNWQTCIIVGLVSDVTDDAAVVASFVPVDTIMFNTAGMKKYTVPLKKDGYSAGGKHVAFMSSPDLNMMPAAGNTGIYIDNVVVDIYEPCPMPDLAMIDFLTDTEIKGTVKEIGSASAWQAVCIAAGAEPSAATPVGITDMKFAFSDLTPRTEYDIYLRSACTAADGGYTPWHGPYTVKTTSTPVSEFPFSIGFESDDAGNEEWSFANDVMNHWHIGNAVSKDGRGSLYVTDNKGETSHYDVNEEAVSWAYRTMQFASGSYTVEYDWICYGEGVVDALRIGLLPTNVKLEGGTTYISPYGGDEPFSMEFKEDSTPDEWIPLEGRNSSLEQLYLLNMANKWQHNSVEMHVKEDGLYNLVVFWKNNSATGKFPSPAAAIDNLSVVQTPCVQPTDITIESSHVDSTVITWAAENGTAEQYEVFVTENPDLIYPERAVAGDTLILKTVDEPRCSLTGLLDEWDLTYVFVRSICAGDTYSLWSERTILRTECREKSVGTTFNFDNLEQDIVTVPELGVTYNKHARCFVNGHTDANMQDIKKNPRPYPHVEKNQGTVIARSGEYVLCFSSNSQTEAGGYIALPAFDTESLGGMRISFWMRPFHENLVGKIPSTSTLESFFTKSLTVGSMTDPYDFSTFKEIEVVTYPYTNQDIQVNSAVADDPAGTEYWRQFTVVLPEDCGRYIVLYNEPTEGYSRNNMYVDDITVDVAPDCAAPINVNVGKIRSTSAEVTFHNEEKLDVQWVLHLSSTSEMTDTVICDTLESADPYLMDNLVPQTQYFLRVKQLCAADVESDWTDIVPFVTTIQPPFFEPFDNNVSVPVGWLRSSTCMADMLFSGRLGLKYDNSSSAGWSRDNEIGSEYVLLDTYQKSLWYLLTPDIDMGDSDNLKLTFDIAVTAANSYLPADPEFMNAVNVKFMVLVSDDGGRTWKRENATVWDNTGNGDYAFSSFTNIFTKMTVDMSKHKGKSVQIAFYAAREGDIDYSKTQFVADFHIDNIRLNWRTEVNYSDDICETNSYDNYGFSRHYSELDPGVYEMNRFALAADETRPDTIYNLTLSVNTLSRTYIKDSVCEGQVYGKYNFSTDVAGIQKQKFTFGGSRCDSVVYLDLKVMPVQETVETATICQGQQYEWNGRSYDRTGVYTDTLQSKSCPCDSVVTLVLTVTEAEVTHIDGIVCFGEVYDFGGMILTESGIYRDTVTNSDNCMSITELTLTVLPDYRRSYTAYFCKGTEYSDENFVGVTDPGTYTNPLKSKVGGCDSTITMTLIALGGDTTRVTKTITVEELPFAVEGTDVTYGLNTNPGEYIDTIKVEIGEEDSKCFEVLIHTLIVKEKEGTGVCNVKTRELVLSPNPVRAEEVVTVRLDLTASERGGLVVQLYSNTGSLVRQFKPEHDPIMIDGFPSAGLYIVRIIDGNGSVYTGKVVVR